MEVILEKSMPTHAEKVLPVGVALDRFIKQKQDEFPYATGELSQLLRDIAIAGKIINREIRSMGLQNIVGAYGTDNTHGEKQQKLDVLANIRFIRALKNGGEACAVISEEEDGVININKNGNYIVALDPLDGSSNIDVNVAIGTIFSIYRRKSKVGTKVTEDDFFQEGRNQVAAGYVLYGSSTMLVYTTGHGVHAFTYEPSLGEFFLSDPTINIPGGSNYYSVNEGNSLEFEPSVNNFINSCKIECMKSRYIGSLVADFHRNLIKGGIYLYPRTKANPKGKLRLMYECNALAFLAEQAGGMATDGYQNIMDIKPTSLHQTVPLFIGSKNLVKRITI